MGKIEDVYYGMLLKIKIMCQRRITWCDSEIAKLNAKRPDLKGMTLNKHIA